MFPAYPSKPHKSGLARIRVKGKDVYLGPFGSKESRDRYAELSVQHAGGVPLRSPRVFEVVDRWRHDGVKRYAANSSEPKAIDAALTVLCRLFSRLPSKDVTPAILDKVRESMASGSWMTDEELAWRAKHKKPVAWCRRVVNRAITRIKTVWKWAERSGLVPPGSWAHLGTLDPIRKHDARYKSHAARKPATWEQVAGVIDRVPPHVAVMLELQWHTGMRPSEVVKIRPCDVSLGPNGCLVYVLNGHKGDWRENDGGHFVLLNSECQRVLSPLLAAARSRGLKSFLFPSSRKAKHRHYTTDAYARVVTRICKETGTPHFTPYQLRHAAKRRAARVAGLHGARALLGQTSLESTAQYDREQDIELASQVAQKIA